MSLKTVQRLLALVICCFVAATCYISVIIFERQAALQRVSRYNAAWTVSQAHAEFLRLGRVLASYAVPQNATSFEEVELRLDVMFSRLATFENSPSQMADQRSLRRFVKSDAENEEVIGALRRVLEAVDVLVKAGPRFDASRALMLIEPLEAQLTAFASRAAAYGTARAAEDRDELRRLHVISTALAGGLILCGVILIGLLLRQNRLLRIAHDALRTTTRELEETHGVLAIQNQRFDAALNNMSQALCTCDAQGRLVVCNERFMALLGRGILIDAKSSMEEALAAARSLDRRSVLETLYERQLRLIGERRKASFTVDVADGRSFAVTHEPLTDGGWLATYEDVSERNRVEARIRHLAHHDALTDLPNRSLLREWLEMRCARVEVTGEYIAILLLDLDGFKEVNDTLGHHVGDELLRHLAARLHASVGGAECVARLGGDEFAVLAHRTSSAEDVFGLAEQVLGAVSQPYQIEGQQIVLSASIGIARERKGSCTPGTLLKHADLAMYEAKAQGKAKIVEFSPEMQVRLQERKSLEADLRDAVASSSMEVWYQPLLDTQTLKVQGYEALVRWKRPNHGYVSPAEFIPVAEEIGLIDSLGEWVLREACRTAAGWPNDLTISVNLSPLQFRTSNLLKGILTALEHTRLPPERLEVEITESVLLEATESTLSTLHQLKALGLRIALDDFGTGYSSLSYLSRFPFDKIKIDRAFIRDLPLRSDASAVVYAIIELGKKLGMATTAEGVETEGQLTCLREIGCTQVQGFLFSPPRPAEQLALYPGPTS